MIAKYYRFRVINKTGQTLTYDSGARIQLKITRWKLSSAGVPSYSHSTEDDVINLLAAGGTLANAASAVTATMDNSSGLFLGLHGTISVTTNTGTNSGPVELRLEVSADATTWADAGQGLLLVDALITFSSGAETKVGQFEV